MNQELFDKEELKQLIKEALTQIKQEEEHEKGEKFQQLQQQQQQQQRDQNEALDKDENCQANQQRQQLLGDVKIEEVAATASSFCMKNQFVQLHSNNNNNNNIDEKGGCKLEEEEEEEEQNQMEEQKMSNDDDIDQSQSHDQLCGYVSIPFEQDNNNSRSPRYRIEKNNKNPYDEEIDSQLEIQKIKSVIEKNGLQPIQKSKSIRRIFLVYPSRLHNEMFSISQLIGEEINKETYSDETVKEYSTNHKNYWVISFGKSLRKSRVLRMLKNIIDQFVTIKNFTVKHIFSAKSIK